jgi:CBS-domain-containing membrane protein
MNKNIYMFILITKFVPTFADRRCHVVSVTDPYGRILGFLDRT